MKPALFIVLICLLGCGPRAGGSQSAADRADQLNAAKTRARNLLATQDYTGALAVLLPLSQDASADHQVFAMTAEAQAATGNTKDAIANYEQAIRLSYADYHSHMDLARLLFDQGKVGRALTEFELAARYGDTDPVTHHNYALALVDLNRHSQAVAQWRRAYELAPESPTYAAHLAVGLSDSNLDEALEMFGIAADLGADDAVFHRNYGTALQRSGRHRDALAKFQTSANQNPDDPKTQRRLAETYQNLGRYEDALGAWMLVEAGGGGDPAVTVYVARARVELDQADMALADLRALDVVSPTATVAGVETSFLQETLGLALRAVGEKGAAVAHLAAAAAAAPDRPNVLNNYGVILAENGRIKDAKAQWNKVLELDPDNSTARANLQLFDG